MVDQFDKMDGEVDFPHWWQSKIVKAKDILVSAKHYLDFELKEPEIDAMVGVASDEEILDDEIEEGIHDRNITSAPHTNIKTPPKGVGDYDPRERAANLAALKNFGPKDKELKEEEIGKSFQEYSNNELSGYIRELMKQRANAASKRQDSLVDGINRDIKKATHELKKRAQNIKSLTRTDVNEQEGEIDKADILSGELYKLKGKIQDAYFAKIRKFINMGSYEDAEYLLNRVKGQVKEKSLAEIIAQKLKSK